MASTKGKDNGSVLRDREFENLLRRAAGLLPLGQSRPPVKGSKGVPATDTGRERPSPSK